MTTPAPRGGSYRRDPVSELFDRGARILLARAYATPGQWAGTRLADPSPEHIRYFAAEYGIDVLGPDNAPTLGAIRMNAYTRWGRGFTRAVWYQHKWWSGLGTSGWRQAKRTVARSTGALQLEWGVRKPAVGVVPAGRAVRVRLLRGGGAALKAVQAKRNADRIWDDDGNPAARWSDPERRDW